MTRDELLARISIDPAVCGGKPCIRGTRIYVALLLDMMASGTSEAEIMREYPQLTTDDLRAALVYGAKLARDRFVRTPYLSRVFLHLIDRVEERLERFKDRVSARFDKVDARFTALEEKMDARIDGLRRDLETKING